MMKKLLLLGSAIFAFNFAAVAQTTSTSFSTTVVTDTLTYFLNKQLFKIGGKMDSAFASYKAPTSAAINLVTDVTHCGSIFRNADTSLMVNGLEGYAAKSQRNASQQKPISVHLYLCNIDPVTDQPVLPAIDSVVTIVNNPCYGNGLCPPQLVGGNFTVMVSGSVTPNPRRVKGDFAVLIRNYSTLAGDTVHFYRTTTLTQGSPVLTGPGNQFYKTGEGLGTIRRNGVFHKTTHMITVTGFGGWGTDYEFCVAPRVTFTLQASTRVPAAASNACQYDCMNYTVTSSPELNNRQFNLNAFYRDLKPFQQQPVDGFLPDTCVQFDFDDDPRIDTLPHLWGRVQNLFLAPNATSVCKAFDTTGSFMNGHQLGKYRKMTTSYSTRATVRDSFATVVTDCGYWQGIKNAGTLNNISVYPNPAVQGKTNITGLEGKNTIVVYDVLGQVISSEVTEKSTVVVDLLKQSSGTYTIRITNADNRTRVVKLINIKD